MEFRGAHGSNQIRITSAHPQTSSPDASARSLVAVALNAQRAAEEKRGIIRYLRPEFQNPGGAATTQQDLGLARIETKPPKTRGTKPAWPRDLVSQISAVRAQLAAATAPMKAADIAKAFTSAKLEKVTELLAALEALGQARNLDHDRFAA